jgi:hypothetical protein
MAGAGATLHGTEERLELAPEMSMTLIEVKQRGKGRVKQKSGTKAVWFQSRFGSGLRMISIASTEMDVRWWLMMTKIRFHRLLSGTVRVKYTHFLENFVTIVYIIICYAPILEPDGVKNDALCKLSKPQNAPDQSARISSQGAGPALRLLSLALFRLQDRVHTPRSRYKEVHEQCGQANRAALEPLVGQGSPPSMQ